jgi:hypothetical protein
MRNIVNTMMLSVASIKKGTVGLNGSTGAMLDRNLIRLQTLMDRPLAEVRLDAGLQNLEPVPVWEVLEDVGIGASMVTQTRGAHFVVTTLDHAIIVEADRQILAAAIANLVHPPPDRQPVRSQSGAARPRGSWRASTPACAGSSRPCPFRGASDLTSFFDDRVPERESWGLVKPVGQCVTYVMRKA